MILGKASLSKDCKLQSWLTLLTEAYLSDSKLQLHTFIIQATDQSIIYDRKTLIAQLTKRVG
jgi:hypothetical protein